MEGSNSKRIYCQKDTRTAKERNITVDELINELLSPKKASGWVVCDICGTKVKIENLHNHREKVHPSS